MRIIPSTIESQKVDQASHNNPLKDLDEWEDTYANETGKAKDDFRNYEDGQRQKRVEDFYRAQHTQQTLEFVQQKQQEYGKLNRARMGVWQALEELNSLVDDSDPDTDVSQLQHALMTAEAIRKKYPGKEYEWMAVTGLIHDLGKMLSMKWNEPQWAVVGDTFPVGCKFSDKCVFPELFRSNPDNANPKYNTVNGIYKPGCGLSNINMSWGHDEYMYQVCVQNNCKLPLEGLYMIRFHSFYPWHKEGQYKHLEDEQDKRMLKWVKEFNQFDLYSKGDEVKNVEELKAYYQEAILRYFPAEINW